MTKMNHSDLVFQRKCKQLYLYGSQKPDNIIEYRTGKINNDFMLYNNKITATKTNKSYNENNNIRQNFNKSLKNYSNESTVKAFNDYNNMNNKKVNICKKNYSNNNTKLIFDEAKEYWKNKDLIVQKND